MIEKNKYKNIFINIFMIFLTIIVSFFIGEIVIRYLSPGLLDQQKMFTDADFMHAPTLRKNYKTTINSLEDGKKYVITTNNLALRNLKDIPENKSEIELRILCLGDSFTFGLGVSDNETFTYYLEQILNNKFNKDYTVMNAGFTAGWGTDTEYLYLKSKIKRLRPDIVLVGFFISNDLSDIYKNKWIVDEEGLPVDIIHPGNKIPRFLKYKSGIYQHFRVRFANRLVNLIKMDKKEEIDETAPKRTPFTAETWDKLNKLLLKMEEISENNDARFFVLIVPIMEDILGLRAAHSETNFEIYEKLVELCQKSDIETIDLLKILKKHPEDKVRAMHLEKDGHWNSFGSKIVAEEIFSYLSKEDIFE